MEENVKIGIIALYSSTKFFCREKIDAGKFDFFLEPRLYPTQIFLPGSDLSMAVQISDPAK